MPAASPAPHAVVVIGSNMMDLVTYLETMPAGGETVMAPSFAMGHGGKGANQAIAASRLGSDVRFVTKVGEDAFGEAQLSNFSANGIDTSWITRASGLPSGVATILVEPSGENRIVIVKGANDALSPTDVEAASDAIAGAAIVLLQLEIPLDSVYRAVDIARDAGVPSVLNPAPAVELDIERLEGLGFLVPNQHELRLLSGLPVGNREDVIAAARSLILRGIGAIVVTLGAEGALYVTRDDVRHVAAPRVAAVDTTGAGDAFIGAFANAIASGAPVLQAIETAVGYAADSVTRRGAQASYATAEAFADGRRPSA